jgi:hypothetical protein
VVGLVNGGQSMGVPETSHRPDRGTDSLRAAVSDRSRFVAALAYVPTWCFLPYFVSPPDDTFARGHGRQAFLLLFVAIVLGLATRLAEWALSPVPLLGMVSQVVMRLVFAVGYVLVSGLGALRALTGEAVTLRPLARLASRLPI